VDQEQKPTMLSERHPMRRVVPSVGPGWS